MPVALVVELARLLEQFFTPSDLRKWLLELDPDLASELLSEKPHGTTCLALAEALQRHGHLGPSLLSALRRARPRREAEIAALERLFPRPPRAEDHGLDRYTLFCHLLDRDAAWDTLARACEVRDGPVVFLLHGSPEQDLALFLDRAHLYLDDEGKDGVRREHQVCEVAFEREHTRPRTVEEWEANFRRATTFPGRSLIDHLRRALREHALMFVVRGRGSAPLSGLAGPEQAALAEFLGKRLPAALAEVPGPRRALRLLLGVERAAPDDDLLIETLRAALQRSGLERKVLELHDPSLTEVLESVERFLSDRQRALTPGLRRQCEQVYHRHSADVGRRSYRDLADHLFRVLSPHLAA